MRNISNVANVEVLPIGEWGTGKMCPFSNSNSELELLQKMRILCGTFSSLFMLREKTTHIDKAQLQNEHCKAARLFD